jgi:hypothetical protein
VKVEHRHPIWIAVFGVSQRPARGEGDNVIVHAAAGDGVTLTATLPPDLDDLMHFMPGGDFFMQSFRQLAAAFI